MNQSPYPHPDRDLDAMRRKLALQTLASQAAASEAAAGRLRAMQQRIDEALEESFPASDPPYWTLGNEEQEERNPLSPSATRVLPHE